MSGDGKVDLVTANGGERSLSLFLGQPGPSFSSETKLPTSASVTSLAVGDLDGDGKLDLVAASELDGQIYTFLNSAGSPLFTSPLQAPTVPGPSAIALGDV